MRSLPSLLLIVCLGAVLAACHSKPVAKPATGASQTVTGADAQASAAQSAGAGQGNALGADGSAATQAVASTIYFDYDSSEIKPEFASVVSAHARRLAADKTLHVRLEGNTDERGSAEYNVALGERRAQAVKRALLLQGASEGQLATVSYGEERPAVTGHTEEAWARNRRVDIVYLN